MDLVHRYIVVKENMPLDNTHRCLSISSHDTRLPCEASDIIIPSGSQKIEAVILLDEGSTQNFLSGGDPVHFHFHGRQAPGGGTRIWSLITRPTTMSAGFEFIEFQKFGIACQLLPVITSAEILGCVIC